MRMEGTLKDECIQGGDDSDQDSVFAASGIDKRRERFHWTTDLEVNIIDWWKMNEALYNQSLPAFHDRHEKERLFSEKASEIHAGCSPLDVKVHLRSLRTKLAHIMKKTRNGSEGMKSLTPREKWVYDKLDFIRPFIISRRSKSNSKDKPAFMSFEGKENHLHAFKAACSPMSQFKPYSQPMSAVPQDISSILKMVKGASGPMSINLASVIATQEAEKKRSIDNFLEHLRSILSKMTELSRMDLQEQIIAIAYQRSRMLWLTRQSFPSFNSCFQPFQQPYSQSLYQPTWQQQLEQPFGSSNLSTNSANNQEPVEPILVDSSKNKCSAHQLNISKET